MKADNPTSEKESLLGKNPDELRAIAAGLDLPAFTGNQIAYWLYKTSVTSFDEMTNISKQARRLFSDKYTVGCSEPVNVQQSADGTRKYLFRTNGDRYIETAYIPDERRHTLCVSSQVGCKMGCLFCMTGKQGFQAHLTAGEILNQLRSIPERKLITNIVFMGMGEPFDNPDAVVRAQEILTAEYGFALSVRKVTVSTIGILPGIEYFLKNSKCNLAVSLHSPFDDERRRLMPIQHVYPIKEVIDMISKADLGKYRRVSMEYIVFKGVNDTPRHVKELARLLNKTRCRINLIRFHKVPGVPLEGSDEETVLAFQRALNDKGITTTLRASRGLDIDAACGLLSTRALVEKKNNGL